MHAVEQMCVYSILAAISFGIPNDRKVNLVPRITLMG
jgi:hypothetical protein